MGNYKFKWEHLFIALAVVIAILSDERGQANKYYYEKNISFLKTELSRLEGNIKDLKAQVEKNDEVLSYEIKTLYTIGGLLYDRRSILSYCEQEIQKY